MPVDGVGFYRYEIQLPPWTGPGPAPTDCVRYARIDGVFDGWTTGVSTLGLWVDEEVLAHELIADLSVFSAASVYAPVVALSHWVRVPREEVPPGWRRFLEAHEPSPAEALASIAEGP